MPFIAVKHEVFKYPHHWQTLVEVFEYMWYYGEAVVEGHPCSIYQVIHEDLKPGAYFVKPVWCEIENVEPFVTHFETYT